MRQINWQDKGKYLLDMLEKKGPKGEDLGKYLAFVLESFYEEGYKDAVYSVVTPSNLSLND